MQDADMMIDLNALYKDTGTRFSLLTQPRFLCGFEYPETVWVSTPPSQITSGPGDARLSVIDVMGKPHTKSVEFEPHDGEVIPPARPGPDGHYDHLGVGDTGYRAVNVYGSIRRVLDIWEAYLGHKTMWHFSETSMTLQVTPFVDWNNAQFAWGFTEFGWEDPAAPKKKQTGKIVTADKVNPDHQFAYNFDIIAHELGHGLIFALAGIPFEDAWTADYRGFQESGSDLVALLSSMHFDTVLDHLLTSTSGNLYAENEINRIAETSENQQFRIASNTLTLADVPFRDIPVDDMTSKQIHQLGEPMTGAFFDILVASYQKNLIESGAIPKKLAVLDDDPDVIEKRMPELKKGYDSAYRRKPEAFKAALCEARDSLGVRLAKTWDILGPDFLSFEQIARTFLTVDRHYSGWENQTEIARCFRWRGIGTK